MACGPVKGTVAAYKKFETVAEKVHDKYKRAEEVYKKIHNIPGQATKQVDSAFNEAYDLQGEVCRPGWNPDISKPWKWTDIFKQCQRGPSRWILLCSLGKLLSSNRLCKVELIASQPITSLVSFQDFFFLLEPFDQTLIPSAQDSQATDSGSQEEEGDEMLSPVPLPSEAQMKEEAEDLTEKTLYSEDRDKTESET